jgi:hypothetical protein
MNLYKHTAFTVIVAACTLVMWDSYGLADDTDITRESLRGLKEMGVVIENLNPKTEKDGLTRKQIRTDIELKMREAGIKVSMQYNPWLYLRPTILKRNVEGYSFFIDIEVKQNVRLERDPNIFLTGIPTWSTNVVGIVSDINGVRTEIDNLVDTFLNAYLSVNLKVK